MESLPNDIEEQFEKDGYFIVKNLLKPDVIAAVQHAAEKLVGDLVDRLISEGKLQDDFKNENFEKRLLRIKEVNHEMVPILYRAELHKYPEFFQLFSNSDLLDVVKRMLPKAQRIRIFPNYSLRPKLPKYTPHDIVWHQDAGLAADGTPNKAPVEERMKDFGPGKVINCWTPLVPVNVLNGAMKFVPASHKHGIQKHVLISEYRDTNEAFSYGRYSTQIDQEALEKYKVNEHAVDIQCDPGDVVFFSNILFHRGGHNMSDHVRWSFDWRYQDASCLTHRDEKGHIIWSSIMDDPDVVKDAYTWTKLNLS